MDKKTNKLIWGGLGNLRFLQVNTGHNNGNDGDDGGEDDGYTSDDSLFGSNDEEGEGERGRRRQ